ncbi:hypothetical protein EON66_06580 [archaeon]|nr:MAG: hypothetical protein EON66_06580 [archaeon]
MHERLTPVMLATDRIHASAACVLHALHGPSRRRLYMCCPQQSGGPPAAPSAPTTAAVGADGAHCAHRNF